MTKTMRITLTEDFLVPTDDGNIIFEPGDEIEVEYEDDEVSMDPELNPVEPEVVPAPEEDPLDDTVVADPLSFEGNPEVSAEEIPPVEEVPPVADVTVVEPEVPVESSDDEEEVYIEDPTYQATL